MLARVTVALMLKSFSAGAWEVTLSAAAPVLEAMQRELAGQLPWNAGEEVTSGFQFGDHDLHLFRAGTID